MALVRLSLVCLFFCILCPLSLSFKQGDEALYLSVLPTILNLSYSTPLPAQLQQDCGNIYAHTPRLNASMLPSITLPSDMLSSQASALCAPTSLCIVPLGVTLFIDAPLNVAALIVYGNVVWNDVTQNGASVVWICAGYVATIGGNFKIDVTADAHNAFIYIKDNGLVDSVIRTRAFGGYNNATIDVNGRQMARTWSLLSAPLSFGSLTVPLLHDPASMGWRVGDRIQIAPTTSGSSGWSQTLVITALGVNAVTVENWTAISVVDPGTGVTSMGARVGTVFNSQFLYVPETWHALMSAEVINLSRNIIITGDDFREVPCTPGIVDTDGCLCDSTIPRTSCTLGLHTGVWFSGTYRVHYARIEKCGQRGVLGKYCLHFHLLSSCPTCSFVGNAIENGQQRGIVVHETHLTEVVMNVVTDVRGASYYIEDGNELYNQMNYNVAICPWPLSINAVPFFLGGCSIPGTDNGQADTDLNQSGFWALGFVNYLIGNRAANSFNGMLWQEQGLAGGRGLTSGHLCAGRSLLGRIEGNTFHGHGRFGTYLLADVFPHNTDQSLSNNGLVRDLTTCNAWDAVGNERGVAQVIDFQVDYDNVFVGQYSAGDVQYRYHTSINNDALIYWKETKNFVDGCSSHIMSSYYQGKGGSSLALPSGHGTLVIENTRFTATTGFESNHHCNVGTTGGLLCMPQYVFVNITWLSAVSPFSWFFFNPNTNNGALFTLGPADCLLSQSGANLRVFPPYFCALANPWWTYLLSISGSSSSSSGSGSGVCFTAASVATQIGFLGGPVQYSNMYGGGILCKQPLRRLEVFTTSLTRAGNWSTIMYLEVFQNGARIAIANSSYFQIADDNTPTGKQGFSFTIIPTSAMSTLSYRLSLDVGNMTGVPGKALDPSWVIEFSDPIFGNRFPVDQLALTVVGRNCPSITTSLHDRKFIWADSDDYVGTGPFGHLGLGRGACSVNQYADVMPINCTQVPSIQKFGECAPAVCNVMTACNNGFCDCGSKKCACNPGFFGPNCELGPCDAGYCGPNGRCTARYLGAGLPVTNNQCVCQPGFYGPRCNSNPCSSVTCMNGGTCIATSAVDYMCNCTHGYDGTFCQSNCTGTYQTGGTCQPPCQGGAFLYQNYNLNAGDVANAPANSVQDCTNLCKANSACACFTYVPASSTCYMKAASSARSSSFGVSIDEIAGILCTPAPSLPPPTLPPPPALIPPISPVIVSSAVSAMCTFGCTLSYGQSWLGVLAETISVSTSTPTSSSSSSPSSSAVVLGGAQCCQLCRSTPRCAGWSFTNSMCSLYQQISSVDNNPSYSVSTIVSGLVCNTSSTSPSSPSSSPSSPSSSTTTTLTSIIPSCSISNCSLLPPSSSFVGNDLSSLPSTSPSQCCALCSTTTYCTAWTQYQGMCLMKQGAVNTVTNVVSVIGAVSGMVVCAPASYAPVLCEATSTSSCPSAPTCVTSGNITVQASLITAANVNIGICCPVYQCTTPAIVVPTGPSSPSTSPSTSTSSSQLSTTAVTIIIIVSIVVVLVVIIIALVLCRTRRQSGEKIGDADVQIVLSPTSRLTMEERKTLSSSIAQ